MSSSDKFLLKPARENNKLFLSKWKKMEDQPVWRWPKRRDAHLWFSVGSKGTANISTAVGLWFSVGPEQVLNMWPTLLDCESLGGKHTVPRDSRFGY